ncbi:hypothetical protein C8R43DRAFT_969446 [Mycena crocata]|nr:hypothetical protein C8R43DRAFT_969446 [Mycena crocata]
MSTFNADTTLGALLVGTLVSYTLFGVTTTQAYIYYGRYPKDPTRMKALVTAVWLGEFGHLICVGQAMYVMVITNYGHPERLDRIPNSLFASTFIGAVVSAGIQSFFAYRIYVLSKSWWIPCICWAMSLFRVVPSNVAVFAFGIREPIAEFIAKWNWLFIAVWTVSAANDVLIAGTLVFLLYHERSRALKRTAAVVDKLIAWTIETGVLTSFVSIIMLILFVTMRDTFTWLACYVIIARLFSNSLLASLNSRSALRDNQVQEISIPSSGIPASSTFRRPTNLSGSIEMHKVTMTTYDDT